MPSDAPAPAAAAESETELRIPEFVDVHGALPAVRQGLELSRVLHVRDPRISRAFAGTVPVVLDNVAEAVERFRHDAYDLRDAAGDDETPLPWWPDDRLPLQGRMPWPDVWCEWREWHENRSCKLTGFLARERSYSEIRDSLLEDEWSVEGLAALETAETVTFAQLFSGVVNMHGAAWIQGPFSFAWGADKTGDILRTEGKAVVLANFDNKGFERVEEHVAFGTWDLCPWFYFLGLLCVRGSEATETTIPRPERRRAVKSGDDTGWVTYKTLVVRPGVMRSASVAAADDESARETRLHIVRGHIADYRSGAGLFGKHKVLVWMPMHFRGNQETGAIAKTYDGRPKRDPAAPQV
jgi:hypothetical protein